MGIRDSINSLFGWEIKRPNDELNKQTFAPRIEDDGAAITSPSGFYGTYVDLDGTVRTEAELVNRYRDMASHPEVDAAIEQICNESIITEDGEKTVQLILDDLNLDDSRKNIILTEFDECLKLLEFNTKAYDVFRRWYIDGRLYYHAIIDKDAPQEGLKELRYLDPRKIRKVKEIVKQRDKTTPMLTVPKVFQEYYVYSEKSLAGGNKSIITQTSTSGIRIAKDAIVHAVSGLTDTNAKKVLSYLHKAIKPLNQLRALEDATIIYILARAPERRIFYIDVGTLPKMKAEQYVTNIMHKHKNKLVYDSKDGSIKDNRVFLTMLEDYFLPRREGNRGTEISTLPSGGTLANIENVQYFQRKLYKSLNVPVSRLEPEETYNVGRSTEISRDEVTFAKFIDRLRLKFNELFLKILERQLILKQFCSPEEWDQIKSYIKFRYLRDNLFDELKDLEILTQRLDMMQRLEPYIGKYFSHKHVRIHFLKQSEDDIEENDAEIEMEQDDPRYAPKEEPGGFGQS